MYTVSSFQDLFQSQVSALQERTHTFFPPPDPHNPSPATPQPSRSSFPSSESPRKRPSNHAPPSSPTKRVRSSEPSSTTHNLKQEANSEGFKLQDHAADPAFDSGMSMVPSYDIGVESDNDIVCEDEDISRCQTNDQRASIISESEVRLCL
jgi:hypothetical protein